MKNRLVTLAKRENFFIAWQIAKVESLNPKF
jgi:hypothetical protein